MDGKWKARRGSYFPFLPPGSSSSLPAPPFVNIGPRGDFVLRWLSAFIVGWPVAAVTGFIVLPFVRRVALRIVTLIEGKSI